MQDFKDKVAVVTGGANGIGFDIAKALAREGAHVVIADLDQAACDQAAADITAQADAAGATAIGHKCDVTLQGDITALADAAWDKFGHVDLLFNNAGVGASAGPAVKTSDADLRWIFEVNFFGNWNACMEFTRRFMAQGTTAHICNTASENSIGWPMPFLAGYNASKAAVLGYTGMLRMELPAHITVSLLCPGWTRTDIANSGTKRPQKFGGAKPPRPPLPLDDAHQPYEPDTVGAHTLAQIKNGAFYIFPHYAARHLAEERNDEIIAAFDAQTEATPDWLKHDTRSFFEAIQAARASTKQE
jgi:NAD(P)-dependent dehydrogenase (short-subunit alcohol dehydrogenase family)